MLTQSIASPHIPIALAVAIGAVLFMVHAPLATSAFHAWWRRRRRPQCRQCGRRRDRGGPPLLYFRDRGFRCTECVRGGTARPQSTVGQWAQVSVTPATLPPTIALIGPAVAGLGGAGAGRTEEVCSRVAA